MSVEKTKPLWFNEPATCAKGVCESRDDLRIKKYTHLGAFQSSSHFQSQREFGWFQPVLLRQPHNLGWLLSAAEPQERMGAPGAAHRGLELDKSRSAQGKRGCGEGTFVKTGDYL